MHCDNAVLFVADALHTDEETAFALISMTAYLFSCPLDDPRVLDSILGRSEN